jgi:hypothetical protein
MGKMQEELHDSQPLAQDGRWTYLIYKQIKDWCIYDIIYAHDIQHAL